LKVTQDEVVNRQTVLHIEVEPDLLEQHMSRAHTKLAQRTNVPGFRKGKAPRHILERVVGRVRYMEEAIESLTPEVVAEAIQEQDLDPVLPPSVSIEELEPAVKLSATVALAPTITLGDYRALRYDDEPKPVTDEEVEEALERVREGQASWEPIDRSLELGDLATISVVATAGVLKIIDSEDTEYLLVEGTRWPVPGFPEELVGMSTGDSRQFTLSLPEDFPVEEAAGQEATFDVSVSGTKQKVLPPLDDELARNLGENLETLGELRNRIRENLEAVAEQELRRSLEDKMLDAVVGEASIELPPMLVDHETQHVLEEQERSLAARNVPVRAYMDRVGKSEEDLVAEARETAERRLQRSLVIDELVDVEGVEVPDADVDAELEAIKRRHQASGHETALDEEGARTSISRILRRRSVIDRMVRIVRGLEEEEAGTEKEAAATPEEQTSRVAGDVPEASETTPVRESKQEEEQEEEKEGSPDA
jgi:trigger factor